MLPLPVLILVLVEDGLGDFTPLYYIVCYSGVLILVLVEDGLGAESVGGVTLKDISS